MVKFLIRDVKDETQDGIYDSLYGVLKPEIETVNPIIWDILVSIIDISRRQQFLSWQSI